MAFQHSPPSVRSGHVILDSLNNIEAIVPNNAWLHRSGLKHPQFQILDRPEVLCIGRNQGQTILGGG